MLVFQEQVNNTAADQVSPLKGNNIYLIYRASVLLCVLDTNASEVAVGSVCECLLLLHAPVPHWDLRECYKRDFPCHYKLVTMHEASCGMMLPSRRVRVDSGQSKEV